MSRFDVSHVPPQGGYLAKRCPVRAQNDVIRPADPLPVSPELQRRIDQGQSFEAAGVAQLEQLAVETLVVDAETPEALEAATVDAVESRVDVIVGARLPTDVTGRRVGKPDLLVLSEGGGYRAVDFKHHMALEPALPGRSGVVALCSALERPFLEDASIDGSYWARKREEDLLQLAHYQRMLEAAGLASEAGRWGGILGTERRIVWYDLDAPVWRSSGSGSDQAMQSSMERYDIQFDLRLDIIAAAQAHKEDPSVDLLAVPVRIGECDDCPWWGYCRERLQSGSGDVSLIPRIGWREWKIHRDHGVNDRAALARLDPVTARLVSAGLDIPEFQRLVEGLDDDTPIRDLGVVVRAKAQLDRLEAEGVETFGELMRLDRVTATYQGSGMSWLPEQIDLARAALGPSPVYRRRGIDGVAVPRADVEVDVDMENIEEGVYLWGALQSIREDGATPSTYHGFVSWETLTPTTELQNFSEFWNWMRRVRADAFRRGKSFRAYCYNASAENTHLKKLGLRLGILDEVIAFIQSEEWVDLLRIVDDQLITGTGSGLKAIAPLTGFKWSVDDPGGGVSMVQYDIAAAAEATAERSTARDWLVTYNQGDVEATLAIRDWLVRDGALIEPIEALDGQFANEGAPK